MDDHAAKWRLIKGDQNNFSSFLVGIKNIVLLKLLSFTTSLKYFDFVFNHK